jgi:hypothetical protein
VLAVLEETVQKKETCYDDTDTGYDDTGSGG